MFECFSQLGHKNFESLVDLDKDTDEYIIIL